MRVETQTHGEFANLLKWVTSYVYIIMLEQRKRLTIITKRKFSVELV